MQSMMNISPCGSAAARLHNLQKRLIVIDRKYLIFSLPNICLALLWLTLLNSVIMEALICNL